MKNVVKISCILGFLFFISGAEKLEAQSSRNAKKTVVVQKVSHRVPSKKVVYKKPNRKVVAVRSLPNRTIIKHKEVNYYYANNRFYTYSGGRYISIAPQKGFQIKTLPIGYIRINHPSRNYFWFNGIFYTNVENAYEVVEPEIGTVIYELPEDYERVEIDGNSYYEFSNVLYERIQVNGERAYEVVGFIEQ
ncbi:DUF6515 family protein [uncultured Cyclobacterium sp.]|uniref:DUF6515 family protein n=1 Tax=uncultured Cyclobacterium sp. TaxID=453820 RepID=UPI0030EB6D96|tara:strand:- start:51731 stop:52303 length:573 start_codon:yes stop_codon:yes gene_type:complete